jgi:hypothetical protein
LECHCHFQVSDLIDHALFEFCLFSPLSTLLLSN